MIVKLLGFTLLMVVAPISVYFLIANVLMNSSKSSNTWAGAAAALTANIVLVGYIVVAIREDQDEQRPIEQRKAQTGKIE